MEKNKLILLIATSLLFSLVSYSQDNSAYSDYSNPPDELYRKRLKDNIIGFNYGYPNTLCLNSKGNYSNEMLKNNIISGAKPDLKENFINSYSNIYFNIWNSANLPEPFKCNYDQKDCAHPGWVKDNAFVALIGLGYRHNANTNVYEFYELPNDSIAYYANRAKSGLQNLNPNVVSCWGGNDCAVLREKGYELIQYLQA